MSANSTIKIWRKDPRFLTDYYQYGMDLGKPDEVIQPESLVKAAERDPQVPKVNGAHSITKAVYDRLKTQGLSDKAIAAAYGISPTTLGRRKKELGL